MEKIEKKITKFGIEASFVDAKEKCICVPVDPSLGLEEEDLCAMKEEILNQVIKNKNFSEINFTGRWETKSDGNKGKKFLFYFE